MIVTDEDGELVDIPFPCSCVECPGGTMWSAAQRLVMVTHDAEAHARADRMHGPGRCVCGHHRDAHETSGVQRGCRSCRHLGEHCPSYTPCGATPDDVTPADE